MSPAIKHVKFEGRLVMVGFGAIGQGVLPLLLRHIDIPRDRITIITAEERGHQEAADLGVHFVLEPVRRENMKDLLDQHLKAGDFLLNLSIDVGSIDLIRYCGPRGIVYLDTCIEPWAGGYTDASLSPALRSNYALRETALALRKEHGDTTAVLTHGANPGLVSHLVKQALLDISVDTGTPVTPPKDCLGWAKLAQRLGVKVIHIAERDTQVSETPKRRGEFVNTWSVDGFIGEGMQPTELGWGTHERHWPADAKGHDYGSQAAIYLERPGASTRVRTWAPKEGPFLGFLITHGESISIAEHLTVEENGKAVYRPTVHYAYHPCDDAILSLHELAGKNWTPQKHKRLMMSEISKGTDELGVLLMGHAKGAYWYGSRLSVGDARSLAPYNNATTLQVTSSVMAAVIWAMENPRAGIVEPDDMDYRRIIDLTLPYLGELSGSYGDWTPLQDRGTLYDEDIDREDPWQFKNFRVV